MMAMGSRSPRRVYQYRSLAKRIQGTVFVRENYFRAECIYCIRLPEASNNFPSDAGSLTNFKSIPAWQKFDSNRLSWFFAAYNVKKNLCYFMNRDDSRENLMIIFLAKAHKYVKVFNNDNSPRNFRDKFYKAVEYLILRFTFNCNIKI